MRTNRPLTRRRSGNSGAQWLSFSDLMSTLLLIFILIMFYIMYQYFDMYEINMAEIARQQYDLDQANADLDEQRTKLSEAESQMLAQQIRLNAAKSDLEDAESVLASQQAELSQAQSLLTEKENEIAAQQQTLDALSIQLGQQQTQIDEQQAALATQESTLNDQAARLLQQQTTLDEQKTTLDTQKAQLLQQQTTLETQASQLNQQQLTLEEQQQIMQDQQYQIEQLVGLKTRIIRSLSDAFRVAGINAQVDPSNGSIALESDVLFALGRYELTDEGKRFVDNFLPVYLDVLFSDEYRDNVTEIIIEGHTDSIGGYLDNLQLSQRRALAVASYVLADSYGGISARYKQKLREVVTANGRSFSDPVLDAYGNEDMDASRRVVFKFRLTDEQMIQQLKAILEKE